MEKANINYCRVIPLTFIERYNLYMKRKKAELVEMLTMQDKLFHPERTNTYAKRKKSELANMLAERDLLTMPSACAERYEEDGEAITTSASTSML